MYNKATLIGNIGNNPEIRTTQAGEKVSNFSLATTETWRDADGLKQEKTTWHKIVVYGGLVSVVENLFNKGDRVFIEGKINNRKYNDKNGNPVYVSEILVQSGQGRILLLHSVNKDSDTQDNYGYDEDAF